MAKNLTLKEFVITSILKISLTSESLSNNFKQSAHAMVSHFNCKMVLLYKTNLQKNSRLPCWTCAVSIVNSELRVRLCGFLSHELRVSSYEL